MRLGRICLLLLAGTVVGSALADDGAAKKAMQAGMDKYAAAWTRGDLKTTEKIIRANFLPSFRATDMHGKTMGLEQWIQQDKQQRGMMKQTGRLDLKIDSFRSHGNMASGKEHVFVSGTMANPMDPKKTSKMSYSGKVDSTYVKKRGQWMAATFKTTWDKFLVDGKPFPPASPKKARASRN